LAFACFAQTKVQQYEYWFDDGYSAKTNVPFTPTSSYELKTLVATVGLPVGLHTFQIRIQDNAGAWSSTTTQFFVKKNATTIEQGKLAQYEYWFDNEYTDKKLQEVSSQSDLSLVSSVATNQLPAGLHTFQIRFREATGAWSSTTTQFFVKPKAATRGQGKLAQYEYWFDNDYAGKTAQEVSPQSDLSLVSSVATSNLPEGLHTFQIRFRESTGAWSSTTTQFFVKTQATTREQGKLAQYEYWFDNDYAGKTAQEVSPQSDLSLFSSVATSKLPAGLHTFQIRFREATGAWSSTTTQFFVKPKTYSGLDNNKITAYRYWLGNEFDKQITITVDPANPLIMENQLIPISAKKIATPGDYEFNPDPFKGITVNYNRISLFNIQFKDMADQWSSISIDTTRYKYIADVICDTLHSKVPFVKTIPTSDTIHFYSMSALEGDSLVLQLDQPFTIDIYDPFGKKLLTVPAEMSTQMNGIRAKLDGEYYALVRGFKTVPSEMYTINYTHIAKYAVLAYTPKKVGNKGTSLLTIEGNGFTSTSKVRLVQEGGLVLTPLNLACNSMARLNASFNFDSIPIGFYNLEVDLGDTIITITDGMEVEGNTPIELDVTILGSTVFRSGAPVTYTIQVENKGNTTAYGVPLGISIKYDTAEAIKDIKISGNISKPKLSDIDCTSLSQEVINAIKDYCYNFKDRQHFLEYYDATKAAYYLKNDFYIASIAPNSVYTITITISANAQLEISANVPSRLEDLRGSILKNANLNEFCCGYKAFDCVLSMVGVFYEITFKADEIACAFNVLSTNANFGFTLGCDAVEEDKNAILADLTIGYFNKVIFSLVGCVPKNLQTELFKRLSKAADILQAIASCSEVYNSVFISGECNPNPPKTDKIQPSPIRSYDPNDKIGYRSPSGSKSFNANRTNFTYIINFENKAIATAPAQEVYITDTLDLKSFDINSFKAGYVKIGNKIVQAPFDAREHTWKVDMRPAMNLITEVHLTLDKSTGIAHWYLKAIDPMTDNLPTDPFVGFLPPNDSIGSGQGCVAFTIDLKEGIEDEATVSNRASIVFDYNKPILTPTWSNKKDLIAPTSKMSPAVLASDTTTTISWLGQDNKNGSGVYCYNVFVKKGTSEYTSLLTRTSQTTTDFVFEKGIEYSFYVTAVDSADNKEAKVKVPDITFYDNSVGVKDLRLSDNGEMIVYPNPSKLGNEIQVEFTYPEESLRQGRLIITSLNGTVLRTINQLHKRMVINGLRSGVYTINLVIDRNDCWCEKIVVE